MQHVSELIPQPSDVSAPRTASDAKPSELTERHIALLWERMAMMYGHKWTSQFGDKDDGTWLTGLSDVTVYQIKRGLEKLREQKLGPNEEAWPPGLLEFRSLCLVSYAAPYHRPFPKALPRPDADPAVAERELAKMRAMLPKPPVPQDPEAEAERAAIQAESQPTEAV